MNSGELNIIKGQGITNKWEVS